MLRKLLILTCLLIAGTLQAQDRAVIDSLEERLTHALHDTAKARTYVNLSRAYPRGSDSSRFYLRRAMRLSDKYPASVLQARVYSRLGSWHTANNDLVNAVKHYELALTVARKIDDVRIECLVGNDFIRGVLLEAGQLARALRLGLSLHEKAKEKGTLETQFDVALTLAMTYQYLSRGEDEREYARIMEELAQQMRDRSRMGIALFYLAVSSEDEMQTLKYYRKSIPIMDSANNPRGRAAALNNMALTFGLLEQYDSCIYYSELGFESSREVGRLEGMAAARLNASRAYLEMEKFQSAVDYAKEALEYFDRGNIIRRQDDCADVISKAHQALGNHKESFEYLELKFALEDSFLNEQGRQEAISEKGRFELQLQMHADSVGREQTRLLERAESDKKLAEEERRRQVADERFKRSRLFLISGIVIAILLLGGVIMLFRGLKKQRMLTHMIEEKNREIVDSIQYAKRIQAAILPSEKIIKEALPDSFVFYQPKDIVAGDFYWIEQRPEMTIFAVADCTGHGVPGAMVSVVCHNALNRAVREFGITDPGKLLDKTREIVVHEFEKSEERVLDGMDISLCTISGQTLHFSGAHNPLWIARNGEINEIKGDKQPVGKFDRQQPFTTHQVDLQPGDTIYLLSDGFADQFGGPSGKKYKSSPLKQYLLSMGDKPMQDQTKLLSDEFNRWRADLEQIDDVCVMGVRVGNDY